MAIFYIFYGVLEDYIEIDVSNILMDLMTTHIKKTWAIFYIFYGVLNDYTE